MKILITGGAGFMGSNFIKFILAKYPAWEITNLDKLTYAGNLENLEEVKNNPNYSFVHGDIAVASDVDKAIGDGVDTIINYAAETHVDRSILDPEAFIRTDIFGTYTLLEAVRRHKTSRLVQISTDEVFGSIETGAFTESSPFMPNSPYSASKAGADHLCRAYHATYGTPVIVTHSCNFYGPNQYPEKLIPLFVTNLLEEKKVPVYGQGEQTREWIFTEDHCRAVETILQKGKIGEVYNIGTGEEKKNIDTAKMILEIMGRSTDCLEFVADRPGHDWRYAVDSSKLRAELGWAPQVKFDDGLKKTIEWYEARADWWQKIKSGEYLDYYKKQYHK